MKFKIVQQSDRVVAIHRLRTEQYTTKKGRVKTRPVKVSVPTNGKPKFKKVYDDLVQVQPGDLVLTPVGVDNILHIGSTVRVLDRIYKVIGNNKISSNNYILRSYKYAYEYPSITISHIDDVVDVMFLAHSVGEGSNYKIPDFNKSRV